MMYEHVATFVGSRQFPLDMLRYDRCYPDSSEDAARIARSVRGEKDQMPDGTPPPITVVHVGDRRAYEWTEGRWASFGWHKVKSDSRVKR